MPGTFEIKAAPVDVKQREAPGGNMHPTPRRFMPGYEPPKPTVQFSPTIEHTSQGEKWETLKYFVGQMVQMTGPAKMNKTTVKKYFDNAVLLYEELEKRCIEKKVEELERTVVERDKDVERLKLEIARLVERSMDPPLMEVSHGNKSSEGISEKRNEPVCRIQKAAPKQPAAAQPSREGADSVAKKQEPITPVPGSKQSSGRDNN